MPRPAYLDAGTGCPRPSTITAEARDSDVYRCRRLRGLLNLYHWAMEYSLHCASDWKLGESPYSFTFTEGDLWKLGIETVGDLASSSCRAIAQTVHAQKRDNSSEFGSFNPRSLTLGEPPQNQSDSATTGEWNPRYTVKSTSRAGSDATPLLFDEKDLVGPIRFYHPELDDGANVDWQERLPFVEISTRLRNASNCAEKFLASCGAKWNGPFFLNFERARELLKHLDAKRSDSKAALADLEQHRLECVAQVELALRQAFEDETKLRPTPPSVNGHTGGDSPFVPNIFQTAILKALDGRALKKQQLADEVCGGEGSRLYKGKTRKGDINELRDLGLVDNKPQLGFYRPAAPPRPKD